jgi:hypothetical protein
VRQQQPLLNLHGAAWRCMASMAQALCLPTDCLPCTCLPHTATPASTPSTSAPEGGGVSASDERRLLRFYDGEIVKLCVRLG